MPTMTIDDLNEALGIVQDPEETNVPNVSAQFTQPTCGDVLSCGFTINCGCYSTYCCSTDSC